MQKLQPFWLGVYSLVFIHCSNSGKSESGYRGYFEHITTIKSYFHWLVSDATDIVQKKVIYLVSCRPNFCTIFQVSQRHNLPLSEEQTNILVCISRKLAVTLKSFVCI